MAETKASIQGGLAFNVALSLIGTPPPPPLSTPKQVWTLYNGDPRASSLLEKLSSLAKDPAPPGLCTIEGDAANSLKCVGLARGLPTTKLVWGLVSEWNSNWPGLAFWILRALGL